MTTIDLIRDEATAVIDPIGASLRAFTVAGRPVVVGVGAFDGAVLAPWPNRIADGRYAFAGEERQLPITEPERSTALHGLVADTEWEVREHTESAVSLTTTLEPSAGYPHALALAVDYELGEASVSVRARARNIGAEAAPFGFGFHPWLHPGDDTVDEAQLVIPAGTWYSTDDRLIPVETYAFDQGTAIPPDHGPERSTCLLCKDFRALRTLGDTVLDDAFGVPGRGEDGWSRARLRGGDGREIRIGMDQAFRTWQVCSGDGLGEGRARSAIAIEPMTCPPNAFAAGEDFDVLAPGEELSVAWDIALV